MSPVTSRHAAFHVSAGLHLFEGLVSGLAPLWIGLGRLESDLLLERIDKVAVENPVYICGLARSGTTVLLELLAAVDGVVTHRYRDFPPIYTPFLWNRLLDCLPKKKADPVERTHRDGIMITPDSPEAFEEVLWMKFFPWVHDPALSNVLDEHCRNPAFEKFYRDHIRKLMLARGGRRYVSKGNYNVTRLHYLLKMMPDARLVLAVRHPTDHIASLMAQHALFCDGERTNARAVAHLRRVGHFEFGLDRRPINTGDEEATRAVIEMWQAGDEIRAWARYWSQIYRYLSEQLAAHEALRKAAIVVRFEDLCREPEATLTAILEHCRLRAADDQWAEMTGRLRPPPDRRSVFSAGDLAVIDAEAGEVAQRFGY